MKQLRDMNRWEFAEVVGIVIAIYAVVFAGLLLTIAMYTR